MSTCKSFNDDDDDDDDDDEDDDDDNDDDDGDDDDVGQQFAVKKFKTGWRQICEYSTRSILRLHPISPPIWIFFTEIWEEYLKILLE